MASENNWSGLVINGCIRDSKVIRNVDVGVKALGTNPVPSIKDFRGEKGGRVTFGGVEFVPGQWLYADEVSVPLPTEDRLKKKNLTQCIANKDGIIISEKELDIDS
jgi:regulator of ribonuclease activity A